MFVEIFAGAGVLTARVKRKGIQIFGDMDIISDGIDLTQERHQRESKARLKANAEEGWKISLTIANPCRTLSQARNQNRLTRIRSSEEPRGVRDAPAKFRADIDKADALVAFTQELADWVHTELDADVSVENPGDS